MKHFKRQPEAPALSREEALNCIPVKSRHIHAERMPSGDALIAYPQQLRPLPRFLLRRLGKNPPAMPPRKLQLDNLGTDVWNLINDRRSVRRIVKRFAEIHRLPRREAELSVTRFLRELGKRGLVAMKRT